MDTILELPKEITKKFSKYYSNEAFLKDAQDYINAIKERRMLCTIHSVSKSGMSRCLSFKSPQKTEDGYYYRNYYGFFEALGFSPAKEGFRISGCGMDMVFHTNYTIIHRLQRLGLITKEDCEKLTQETPVVL
jgi:hypothetical protein